jgi:hypothetical protein
MGNYDQVQDYRKVNEWTIRNRYPLPLIPELINRVKTPLFSQSLTSVGDITMCASNKETNGKRRSLPTKVFLNLE